MALRLSTFWIPAASVWHCAVLLSPAPQRRDLGLNSAVRWGAIGPPKAAWEADLETERFDSSSLAETEEFLSRAYTPMRIGGRPNDTQTRIARTATDGLIVDRLSFGYTMSYDANPLGMYCLITVHSGSMVDTTDGRHDIYGPGESFLIALPDRPYTGALHSARYTITMFDPTVLDRAAALGARPPQGPVRFTGQRAHDAGANRRLGSTVAFLRDHVMTGPSAPDPLVITTATQHLAAAALTAFPSTAQQEPCHHIDSGDAHTETLRRARTFIEENAHRAISLSDIAAAAFVTPRAVQYAFRRHADTTPLAFLRQVRLTHAHRDLQHADPHTSSVTVIASRWGFAHVGRFAAAYRRLYGVTPGATLHAGD
ncbi:AraC family transcriptional regulator [Streptomyces sp. NPDC058369]|uniref:helix-turn-helix transcriptional regulator n=1 Tax=unclassified Streptomyces TaxID=2593676 RepID=UPI00224CFF2F|nr:AraC family transcriptional regulator [Streptomyces sp. NBC_01789]MCX4451324.1 AraC family transcriptional regulator [Streptomyces sp. NBC_01789]